MPLVTFVFEGQEKSAQVPPGTTLLEASEDAGARLGHACGGVCACSTCHVWVHAGGRGLSEAEDREQDILDKAFDVRSNSRLGCQAAVTSQDVRVEITPESLRSWYDENPDARRSRDGG